MHEAGLGRFRCVDKGCGWAGLLTNRLDTDGAPHRSWRLQALRGLAPLLLAGLAVFAAQWGAGQAPVASVAVGTRHFAPGEAFDGEALPAEHPLLLAAGEAAATQANGEGHASAVRAPPLTLRRHCAWGRPGRMPYQGSMEEALRTARLPKPVRDQILAAAAAGRPHDRLLIANDGIRTTSGGRRFDADGFAMTYGRTLCLGTRVNFRPGHVEPAILYEAYDDAGRRYSVMVPDVCGNVSVLRRGPERGSKTASGSGTVLSGLDPLDPGDSTPRVMHAVVSEKPHEVPVPGTLALSLLGLATVLGVGKRRNATRTQPATGPHGCPPPMPAESQRPDR